MSKRPLILLPFLFLLEATSGQIPPFLSEVPADVHRFENLTYAQYGDYTLQLDLYRPSISEGRLPAIVVISEGGWEHANKELNAPLAAGLAQRGFVAVSIEYRGAREEVFPASVHDVKAAVRWLRANAETHGVDPNAIGAIGGSWGGFLSVYSGVTAGIAELQGGGDNGEDSSDLSAIVGLSALTDLKEFPQRMERYLGASLESDPSLWEFASPITHVNESSPPLLLIASQADTTVPYEQSVEMARVYGEAGLDIELVLIPEAGHAFWYLDEIFEETVTHAAQFFYKHLGGQSHATGR